MAEGLEQANARMDQRAQETERRLARPDPAQPQPEPEAELGALPEPEGGDLPPDDLEALPAVDPRAMQEQDQQLLDSVKAWMEGGETPEAFKSVIHEWTDKTTGAPRRMTIAQMEEGVLRQSDYQRNMNELRGYHQQVQFRDQANNQFWNTVREPKQMLEEFEDRDLGDVFHQAAVEHSIRRQNMKQVAEAAGFALMQRYGYQQNHPDVVNAVRQTMQAQLQSHKLEIENRKLTKHNQMLAQMRQQQDGQQQHQVRLQELQGSIAPLIAPSFKSAGVRHSPSNVQDFYKHLAAYVSNQRGWDGNVRRKDCVEAAKMVREELEDRAAASAPKKPAQQSRAMGPSKLSSSGSAQQTTPERKRISDMANDPRFTFGVG